MPQSDPSRTEDATPKRIKKAREEGQVPRSQEGGKTASVLMGLIVMHLYIGFLADDMLELFNWAFSQPFTISITPDNVYSMFVFIAQRIAVMVLPVILPIGFLVYIITRLQVGPLWSTKVFQPKLGKLFNIVGGLKRMVGSLQTVVNLGKSIIIATCVAVACYKVIMHEMPNFVPLFDASPFGIATYILEASSRLVLYALLPMIILTIADIFYQRWEYFEGLKMTKDEVKDERRQAEGDPKVKAQQRQKMMEMMAQRMLQDVPRADVVITNPTHIAIAIKYDPLEAPAPLILAKGADHMAEKIKEVARENGVPIRENKPLARALYKMVEVGDLIPEELYQAVATILAQLFKFRSQHGG